MTNLSQLLKPIFGVLGGESSQKGVGSAAEAGPWGGVVGRAEDLKSICQSVVKVSHALASGTEGGRS